VAAKNKDAAPKNADEVFMRLLFKRKGY